MLNNAIVNAGFFGFIGVSMGAFGAHAMKMRLAESGLAGVYQTASLYCLVHALALLGVGCLQMTIQQPGARKRLRMSSVMIALGTFVFSGSLWLLAIFEIKWLGMITPVGGLLLLSGWALILLAGLGSHSRPKNDKSAH